MLIMFSTAFLVFGFYSSVWCTLNYPRYACLAPQSFGTHIFTTVPDLSNVHVDA